MGQQRHDIITGIPSFNEKDNIAFVTRQLSKGLQKYFSKYHSLVVDCDNGSTDNTKKVFLKAKTTIEKKVLVTTKIGKGHAMKMFFEFAKDSKAAACFDADLKSITPEWVKYHLEPIMKKGYDYVTPYYSRYKYDGTITKHICYPLIYGLFCHDIRQPIGGDFAFSGKLAGYWLKSKWPVNASLFGIDVFMTTNAILSGGKIAQSNLGAKVHNVKDPAKTLSPMFRQVISTLFKIIITNKNQLKDFKRVKHIPIFGRKGIPKPQQFSIDNEATKQRFLAGFIRRKETIKKCLGKNDYNKLRNMVHYDNIHIPTEFWVRIVYDYILAFKKYEHQSSTILKSFIPLWFGRVYTFVNEIRDMSSEEAEVLVKKQAKEFFRQRGYLLRKL